MKWTWRKRGKGKGWRHSDPGPGGFPPMYLPFGPDLTEQEAKELLGRMILEHARFYTADYIKRMELQLYFPKPQPEEMQP